MTPTPASDRLSAILSGMDRLDPHTTPTVEQAVQEGCQNAGWSVPSDVLASSLAPVTPTAAPLVKPVSRWRHWGSVAWRACRPDVIGGVLAASWVGKVAFGEAFLHLLGTTTFSSAVLLLSGVRIAWIILQGTWYSAQEGEVLGQKWTSLWTPLHMVLWTSLLLPTVQGPLGQPISAAAKIILALFS